MNLRGLQLPLIAGDFQHLDGKLLLTVLALITLGVVMIYSASVNFADVNFGDSLYFFKRQLMYLALGSVLGLVVLNIPVAFWYRYGLLLLAAAFALLLIVLIPGVGRSFNGSRRWLGLGPMTFQVSELVKLAVVLFMAGYLQRHQQVLRDNWKEIGKPLGILAALVGLLLLEPDLGSSVVLSATVLAMLFFAGAKLWQVGVLVGLAGSLLGLAAVLSPYRLKRLVAYLDPWADQFGSGYQLSQSLIAFGRGEWFGVGLGNSVQKLGYLPEAYTDFVFAVYAEEFGLVGVVALIALFGLLLWRVFAIIRRAVRRCDWFAAYSVFGLGVLLAGQAFINIGVASGLLPTKGLTLPFVSYGGSSLLVSCVMVALILRFGMELHAPVAKKKPLKAGGRAR
ncbi:putative lipid II flippase FtsW [Porticoccus sp. W117]|uniref:putative lipid II flippase FtsW n=1 Tax=Porticoccus sp. W117 TaxID=3054777 RepID=UPI0025970550|nr:putative lipid II flippase FtsW [Porticoccus sp. W117]MDM3871753.1 putative lipid II flippase FtsW [Porticoccus sp. W117]